MIDVSMPSVKDILTNNYLIRGHLRLTSVEIRRLYRLQLRQNQKIHRKLANQEEMLQESLDHIKNLKSKLKYSEETLQKAFHPSTDKIALLYKNIGKHYYIKARFYWRGQQREVQVGSIPIVLDIIKKMLSQGYLHDVSLPKSYQITWEQFKNKVNLINATKEIAALKFQEYIIRKLYVDDTNQLGTVDLEEVNSEKPAKTYPVKKYTDENKEEEKFDWYVQWRNNNLK